MIKVDYITFNFDSKFTVEDFTDFAATPIEVDPATGAILEYRIDYNNYRLNHQYGKSYVSIWGLDSNSDELLNLVKDNNLSISRLDLANDLMFNDADKTFEKFQKQVKKWRDTNKPDMKFATVEGKAKLDNGDRQFTFGAYSSKHQLSVYKKRFGEVHKVSDLYAWGIRVELQLRDIDAKAAFEILKAGDFSQESKKEAFDSTWNRYYPDALPLPNIDDKAYLDIPKETRAEGRKDWFYQQVLPAAITHFDTTGENLAEFLLAEFNAYYQNIAKEAIEGKNKKSKNLYEKRLKIILDKERLSETERLKKEKRGIKQK